MPHSSPPKISLLGLPYDANSSYLQGPAMAPMRIREAFHNSSSNLSSESGLDLGRTDIWQDCGDLALEELSSIDAYEAILKKIGSLIETGDTVLSLGGDHSISHPAIKAHAEHFSGLNILHIDAHCDLYDNMLDNPYSHASPFARLMETGQIKRLVQVGIRTLNPHQKQQAERFGVEIIDMGNWNTDLSVSFEGPVYLSLDLDGLDPAFAPGVSHHEPGGLSTRDVLNLVHNFDGQLIGADIVELNPHRDINNMTAMVAAKFAKEIIARLYLDNVS